MKRPFRVRMPGPLRTYAAGFAKELSRQGYKPNSVKVQLCLMAHASCWLAANKLSVKAFGASETNAFLKARRAEGYTRYVTPKAMAPLHTYLRALGVVPVGTASNDGGPAELLLDRYRRYLTVERGISAKTIATYLWAVQPFLEFTVAASDSEQQLTRLEEADVITYVVARCRQQRRGAAKLTVTALRSLLRFLHLGGVIKRPLADAVPSVAGYRLSSLPKGLSPGEVDSLLGSCSRHTVRGRRDFAILTILACLGLRAGEVAAMKLSDIDWRAGEIAVGGKGKRHERLPLPADVGRAVAAYLRHGRPASCQDRSVFVRLHAPHHGLSSGGVSSVVAAAARRAGLGKVHAHRLRHTVAGRLIAAGASLPEVGQLLRHRSLLTTAIYAKIDRAALRIIARPWPGAKA